MRTVSCRKAFSCASSRERERFLFIALKVLVLPREAVAARGEQARGKQQPSSFRPKTIGLMTEKGCAVKGCSRCESLSLSQRFQFLIAEARPALPCHVLAVLPCAKVRGGKTVVLPAIPFAEDAEGSVSREGTKAGCCPGRLLPLEAGCSLGCPTGHSVLQNASSGCCFKGWAPFLHPPFWWWCSCFLLAAACVRQLLENTDRAEPAWLCVSSGMLQWYIVLSMHNFTGLL